MKKSVIALILSLFLIAVMLIKHEIEISMLHKSNRIQVRVLRNSNEIDRQMLQWLQEHDSIVKLYNFHIYDKED